MGHWVLKLRSVFVPSHTFTYLEHFAHNHLSRTLCTQSHRVAVASGHRKIYLGEACSQLSWGENLRMGS